MTRKRGRSARNHGRNRLAGLNAYRRLTPQENIKAGYTLLARHYVLETTKKITEKTPTLTHRQYRTRQERERHGVASPEIATRAREAGAIPYRSGRAAETAGKIRRSAYVKRLHREILKAAQNGDRINEYSGPGEIKRDRSGNRRGFKAQVWHANYVEDLRERKLTGEQLDNGDWHMMMDYAERFKDPARHILRASPGSFAVKETLDDE